MGIDKRSEILAYLKTTTRLRIADLAEYVECSVTETYKHVVAILSARLCEGYIHGSGANAVFVATFDRPLDAPFMNIPQDYSNTEPMKLMSGALQVGDGSTVILGVNGARDITVAKETVTKESERVIEKIIPFTPMISEEYLSKFKNTKDQQSKVIEKRQKLLDEIEEKEQIRSVLRKKIDKSDEEIKLLNDLSDQINQIGNMINMQDNEWGTTVSSLRSQSNEIADESVSSLVKGLERQKANQAITLVSENRELYQMLESLAVLLNAKVNVNTKDIEKLAKLLNLNDNNIKMLFNIIDGQPSERKAFLKQETMSTLANCISDFAQNSQEISKWLDSIFNPQDSGDNRSSAMKKFLDRSKNWVTQHPNSVNAIKMVLSGIMTIGPKVMSAPYI